MIRRYDNAAPPRIARPRYPSRHRKENYESNGTTAFPQRKSDKTKLDGGYLVSKKG